MSMMRKFSKKASIIWSCAILALYLLTPLYLASRCWRDPTSIFFEPHSANDNTYSKLRRRQAHLVTGRSMWQELPKWDNSTAPVLCVAIPAARPHTYYLETLVASLVDNLDVEERRLIYLMGIQTDVRPGPIENYEQPQLKHMLDRLVRYMDNSTRLKQAEALTAPDWKERYDYGVALEECVNVGAAYVMVLQNSVVALDGWLHRILNVLEVAKTQGGYPRHEHNSFFLRLFHSDTAMRWREDQVTSASVIAILLTSIACYALCILRRRLAIPPLAIIALCIYLGPFCTSFYFLAGRNCMAPPRPGLTPEPYTAIDAEALVYPTRTARALLAHLQARDPLDATYMGQTIFQWAEAANVSSWNVAPVPFQYGCDAAKLQRVHMNYAFEDNDAERLRGEHRSHRARSAGGKGTPQETPLGLGRRSGLDV